MAFHPRIERNDWSTEQGWEVVVANSDHLTAIAKTYAGRADRRIQSDELHGRLMVDLVENIRLFRPEGDFLAWARTRAHLVRTRMLRELNKYAQTEPVWISEDECVDRFDRVESMAGQGGCPGSIEALVDLELLADHAETFDQLRALAQIGNTGKVTAAQRRTLCIAA